jgi:hypothetical protein
MGAAVLVTLIASAAASAGCDGGIAGIDGAGGGGMMDPDGGAVGIDPAAALMDAAPPGGVPASIDVNRVLTLLAQGALDGWVHGAVHDRGLYVFTYRMDNFFNFADFPIIAATTEVADKLTAIKRHDQVRIKGRLVENAAPIRHLFVEEIAVLRPWATDENPARRGYATRIPEDLANKRELIGKVHAVANDGRILVIEYGDQVLPVFVADPTLTDDLYRNDKIKVGFVVPTKPPRPTHLWLATNRPNPLVVLERLADRHGKPVEEEGSLVRFPISPQITRDVYALQVTDADGVSREYTLLNDRNLTVFNAISAKLANAWTMRQGQGLDGRNKLVNPKIRVRARGTFNIIDRNQANAQILLESPDDLTITFLP